MISHIMFVACISLIIAPISGSLTFGSSDKFLSGDDFIAAPSSHQTIGGDNLSNFTMGFLSGYGFSSNLSQEVQNVVDFDRLQGTTGIQKALFYLQSTTVRNSDLVRKSFEIIGETIDEVALDTLIWSGLTDPEITLFPYLTFHTLVSPRSFEYYDTDQGEISLKINDVEVGKRMQTMISIYNPDVIDWRLLGVVVGQLVKDVYSPNS